MKWWLNPTFQWLFGNYSSSKDTTAYKFECYRSWNDCSALLFLAQYPEKNVLVDFDWTLIDDALTLYGASVI